MNRSNELINRGELGDAEPVKVNVLADREAPRDRYKKIQAFIGVEGSESFDPDEISWVTGRIGITDQVGAFRAHAEGHFVINTAREVSSPADEKIVVDPWSAPQDVENTLENLADLIEERLESTDQKIVVHCFLGLERSVLTVVWYLHIKLGLSVDEAYDLVRIVRPVVLDRRKWVYAEQKT